jgi:hypothetical protein
MTFQRAILYFAAGIFLIAPFSRSSAAVITAISTFSLPDFSTGSVGPVGNTPAINNDDDPGTSPNQISYSVFLNSPGALETEFELQNSGGTTEYFFPQVFFNTRNTQWIGFRFELGFGTGDQFVLAAPTSALQFDTLNGQSTATSPVFTLVMNQSNQLDWSVANAPLVAPFSFAIDVPDGLAAANPSGLNRFTLRQTPLVAAAVPEPAAAGIVGVALLGITIRLVHKTIRRRTSS